MKRSKLLRLREIIEMAVEFLADVEALESVELFPGWHSCGTYAMGQRVRHNGILYRCLLAHDAQPGWDPVAAPSLWTRVLIVDPNSIPDWVQPGSTNPYAKGDRVQHKGSVWVSAISDNLWEPGVYGWEIVT